MAAVVQAVEGFREGLLANRAKIALMSALASSHVYELWRDHTEDSP